MKNNSSRINQILHLIAKQKVFLPDLTKVPDSAQLWCNAYQKIFFKKLEPKITYMWNWLGFYCPLRRALSDIMDSYTRPIWVRINPVS